MSEDFSITNFLVDQVTIGEWSLQKLPSDELSIQNGIMVTRSSRYPLMIDPQGQAITWIKEREPVMRERDAIFTLNTPNLRDCLKFPLENGWPVLIESIENEVDPLLDPILEKQIISKGGKKKTIILGGGEPLDFDDKFNLYMTSRLANPHFSPELAARGGSRPLDFFDPLVEAALHRKQDAPSPPSFSVSPVPALCPPRPL